jgi:hypothetical protein
MKEEYFNNMLVNANQKRLYAIYIYIYIYIYICTGRSRKYSGSNLKF